MTDEQILQGLREGNADCFTLMYDRFWKKLYKRAVIRVEEEALAKDIIQDVFMSIWERRQQLEIHTSLENYLAVSVKHQVINYFRNEKVRHAAFENAMALMTQMADADTDQISIAALDESLKLALEDLPEKMRQSFLLRCNNFSIKEIAMQLGIAEQTVSNNLSECVKRLKKKLATELSSEHAMLFAVWLTLLNN